MSVGLWWNDTDTRELKCSEKTVLLPLYVL